MRALRNELRKADATKRSTLLAVTHQCHRSAAANISPVQALAELKRAIDLLQPVIPASETVQPLPRSRPVLCGDPRRTFEQRVHLIMRYMRLFAAKEKIGNVADLSVRKAVKLLIEKPGLHGNDDGNHYWLVPPELYAKLNAEFAFDFDPCPYPRPDGFDGLTCEWGKSSFVNPPFVGPTAWVRKAIAVIFPVDRWFLMLLEAGVEVRNLGDVEFGAIESDGKANAARPIACFILD